MQKILFWFRGGEKSIAEGHEHEDRWARGKKWRSSLLSRGRRNNNGGETNGMDIAQHFDAIASASTSSPAILPENHKHRANGHSRGKETTRTKSERRRKAAEEQQKEKPAPAPHSSERRSRRKGAANTTEDIPDASRGPAFDVNKKAVSANAVVGGGDGAKRPGLLQRIRSRLSTKSSAHKERQRQAEPEPMELVQYEMLPRLAREELRMERLAIARAMKEEVRGEETRSRQHERLAAQRMDSAADRREMMRQQHQLSEDFDAFSQGRNSSFDYFSAAASPTDQPMAGSDRDGASSRMEQQLVEEELRFATAAEARAYLRRQMAAEGAVTGGGGEETAFDADDEISNRLAASAAGDSTCQLVRPHSAMSTSGTGRHQQRESIYFTVVQPDSGLERPQSQAQADRMQKEFELSKHRSKSQMLLAGQQAQDSPLMAGQGSEPGSTRMGRRKLRFVIPQVSICSAEGDDYTAGSGLNAEDEANNNANATSRPPADGVSMLSEDSLNNNNALHSAESSSSVAIQAMLPAMLGVGPEAEQELKRALSQMDKRQLTLAQRRQSNMDFVHQASGRRTSTTLIPLTSAQIHLIRSLWRQVYLSKGPTVIGSQISHRLFFKEPQTREQFRRCPLPQQYVNHDSFSKAHCRQISEMIDQVVESLDDLEHVSAMLQNVGRAHARISGGQLSSKLWNSVAETFIDCTLEWGDRRARSETVRKAWALIIAFMIERIKHGHLEERRQITAIRSTIASLERFGTNAATGEGGYVVQVAESQPQQHSPSQLPVPICPIRRVSATATLVNGVPGAARPVKFSPDQFRAPNSMAGFPSGASSAAASIVSPVANRRKPLRISSKTAPSPKATPRSARTRSDAQRPQQVSSAGVSRKGSSGAERPAAGTAIPQRLSTDEATGIGSGGGMHTDV